MTPSHVIRRARSYPASPWEAARAGFRRIAVDGGGDGRGRGLADGTVGAVLDELQWTACVGRCNHGLVGKEGFERHVAEVFVEGCEDYGERAGVQLDERLVIHRACEMHPVRNAQRLGPGGHVRTAGFRDPRL